MWPRYEVITYIFLESRFLYITLVFVMHLPLWSVYEAEDKTRNRKNRAFERSACGRHGGNLYDSKPSLFLKSMACSLDTNL